MDSKELCFESLIRINHSSPSPQEPNGLPIEHLFHSEGPSSFFVYIPHCIIQEHGPRYARCSKTYLDSKYTKI